jgi:hypothetical protein
MKLGALVPGSLVFIAWCCLAQQAPDAGTTTQPPAAEAEKEDVNPAWPPPDLAKIEPGAAKSDSTAGIAISNSAPYEDERRIAANILKECPDLGRQFSDATQKAGAEQGLKIAKSGAVDPAGGGQVLVLKIQSASSRRHAFPFPGHDISVAIRAELYSGGKLVYNYGMLRHASGGAAGVVRSSCGVLESAVDTLGSDVAKWLKSVSQ